jgi:hypothetical protein
VRANPYRVISAELVTEHTITNNPNDQIRPEDFENEGATGRLPEYIVVAPDDPITPADEEEWVAARDCFEGDGDFDDGILTETTDTGAVIVAGGTYYKNYFDAGGTPWTDPSKPGNPPLYSADLKGGFTNAWYTSLNRDPFEGYTRNIQDIDGNIIREQASGPRWRLKSNKFGQDIPGLEIPLIECSPTPFQQNNIKYVVGETTTTTINLLDWDPGNLLEITDAGGVPVNAVRDANGQPVLDAFGNYIAQSPLATTAGWVDANLNPNQTGADSGLSINGLPLTDDFDLAYYFKGERKAATLNNAFIRVVYRLPQPLPDEIFSDQFE